MATVLAQSRDHGSDSPFRKYPFHADDDQYVAPLFLLRPISFRLADESLQVTCMDPRCDPVQFLGTNPETGDKMLFASIRNPGGRITPDTMRSVLTVRSLAMHSTGGSLVIVHHTGLSFPVPGLPIC